MSTNPNHPMFVKTAVIDIPHHCLAGASAVTVEEMQDFVSWGAEMTIDHKLAVPHYLTDEGHPAPDVAGCYYNQLMVKEVLARVMKSDK